MFCSKREWESGLEALSNTQGLSPVLVACSGGLCKEGAMAEILELDFGMDVLLQRAWLSVAETLSLGGVWEVGPWSSALPNCTFSVSEGHL